MKIKLSKATAKEIIENATGELLSHIQQASTGDELIIEIIKETKGPRCIPIK